MRISTRPAAVQLFAILAGTALLAASSYIQVPMYPVPVTMQTLAVTMVGALMGWRLGGLTIIAWLAQAALGLPVLAGGSGGILPFIGPTAGYLFAFPVIGALTGLLVAHGWNGYRPVMAFLALLLANALCLALGAVWLAASIGLDQAIVHGVTPFIVGGVLKSALGAALLAPVASRTKRPARS
nr:biotin transporter BioY [Aureimonas fodinaquatilis]